jgi:2-dehydropantoate 2-reductase
VKKVLGKKCLVLRAVTNFGAAFLKPGTVKYNSCSYTAIERSERSKEIAENFRKCGLNGHVSENIKYDMWKKLIFNCVLNPITAILKVENNGISDERLNPLKRLIVEECLKVAKKDRVNFGFDFVEIINNEFKNSVNISSMQQDILKGKKTEIDYLNGAVAELGRKYGIKCPVNEALTMIINGINKS